MKTANVNLPLNFNQVVDIIKQLPYGEKLKLSEMLKRETKQEKDRVLTHFVRLQVSLLRIIILLHSRVFTF